MLRWCGAAARIGTGQFATAFVAVVVDVVGACDIVVEVAEYDAADSGILMVVVVVGAGIVVVVVGISPEIGVFPFTTRLQPTSRTPLRAMATNVTLRTRECMARD